VTPGKTTDGSGIRRAVEKAQLLDPRREKHTFEEARREFAGEHASSSREQPEVKECEMPPSFDHYRQGKEVSKLMDLLYTCINLIKDERVVQELQHLIR
jgi:hypothetical protein